MRPRVYFLYVAVQFSKCLLFKRFCLGRRNTGFKRFALHMVEQGKNTRTTYKFPMHGQEWSLSIDPGQSLNKGRYSLKIQSKQILAFSRIGNYLLCHINVSYICAVFMSSLFYPIGMWLFFNLTVSITIVNIFSITNSNSMFKVSQKF